MLYVKIIDLIKGIKSQDWLSASDLFVEIEFEKSKRRTNIIWNNNKPVWNECFLFDIRDTIVNKFISFKIYEQDNSKKLLYDFKFKINTPIVSKYTIDVLRFEIGNILYDLQKKNLELKYKLDNINNLCVKNLNIIKDNCNID